MSVDDSNQEEGKIRVIPVHGPESDEGEENQNLPHNPELNKAMEDALASLERYEKKRIAKQKGAGDDLGQQERESLKTRIKELHFKLLEKEKELEEKTKEVEQFKDTTARRQADLENYKKRVQKEKADQFNYGNEDIAREFLDVLDNLERALTHGAADPQGLLQGIELTRRNMEQTFQKFSIEPIKALGKKFDPNIHQAIAQIPSPDHEPGTVIHEQQRGFMLKDRLLRPSLVIVAGAPENKGAD